MNKNLFLLLVAGLTTTTSSYANWHAQTQAGYLQQDNPLNTLWKSDRQSDSSYWLSANAGFNQADVHTAWSSGVSLQAQRWSTIDELDNDQIALFGQFRWQPTLGWDQFHYYVDLRVADQKFQSDAHSNQSAQLRWQAKKSFTDHFSTSFGFAISESDANQSVFSRSRKQVFVDMDWRINDSWLLYGRYQIENGDITATARSKDCQGEVIERAYNPSEYSDVGWAALSLNERWCGAWWHYKMEADSHYWQVGANYQITYNLALDILWEQNKSNAGHGFTYRDQIMSAAIIWVY